MSKMKNKIKGITKKIIKEYYFLKKEQKRIQTLNESIEYDPDHPERMSGDIEGRLRSGEHTFGGSKSLPLTGSEHHYSEKLASARFKDIITKVKRYHGIENINPQMLQEMMRIMGEVSQIETQHKDALEQLAIDIVSEEFDIPDDMLDAELLPPGSPLDTDDEDEDDDDDEEEFQPKSAERMDDLEIEVDKRNIINALMQGASKKGHYIFHMVADELDQLNPRLMILYGKLMSLADFQYWVIPDSALTGGAIGGTERIKWVKADDDDEENEEENEKENDEENEEEELEPRVEAKAWIFPLLVHELIKGTMELAASNWGEGHLDIEEQMHVIQRADTHANEIWGMRLGPGMWEKFLECIDPKDYSIKQWLFHELTKLPAKEFHKFMKEILSSSGKCKEVISQLKELHEKNEDDSLEDIITGDETNFDDGLDDLLDDAGINNPPEDSGREITPSIPEPQGSPNYSEMSKREIQKLIDDALDAGDFDLVAKLHKFL